MYKFSGRLGYYFAPGMADCHQICQSVYMLCLNVSMSVCLLTSSVADPGIARRGDLGAEPPMRVSGAELPLGGLGAKHPPPEAEAQECFKMPPQKGGGMRPSCPCLDSPLILRTKCVNVTKFFVHC